MSETEMPLHVQVAEALGWTGFRETYPQEIGNPADGGDFSLARPSSVWVGMTPRCGDASLDCPYAYDNEPCDCSVEERIPWYHTQWHATGPLIERYGIQVGPSYDGIDPPAPWCAATGMGEERDGDEGAYGATPLKAVCRLIVRLKEVGKL